MIIFSGSFVKMSRGGDASWSVKFSIIDGIGMFMGYVVYPEGMEDDGICGCSEDLTEVLMDIVKEMIKG